MPGNPAAPRRAFVSWLALAAAAVALVSLAVVYAPQRIKLPLLLPLALSALVGWGLGRLAVARHVDSRRLVIVAVALLAGLGTVLTAYETFRRGVPHVRRDLARQSLENDPLAAEIERQLGEQTADAADESDPDRRELIESLAKGRRIRAAEEERQQRLATFAGYLTNRIPKSWGRWPAPLAIAFWLTEVAGSIAAAAWMTSRATQSSPDSESGRA
jgi:hypothetical protein